MEFSEEIAVALSDLEQNPVTTLPQNLEEYLVQIAKTGFTLYPWNKIKPLFKIKLENVIVEFATATPPATIPVMPNVEVFKFDEMKIRIFEQLESYDGIPFTIQRLCELITEPMKNYKRLDKFMRGLERVMLVVSTTESKPVEPDAAPLPGAHNGAESSIIRSQSPGANPGYRRLGESLESPAKRMRLNIEEDGGPCDSAHPQPHLSPEKLSTENECAASKQATFFDTEAASEPVAASSPSVAESSSVAVAPEASVSADSTPQASNEEDDNMEIDTECTSSQTLLESSPENGEGEEISTSAESATVQTVPEVETNSEAEPSMAEPGADLETAPSSGETAPGSAETSPSSAESAHASESAANEEQQSVESSLISHQTRAAGGDDAVGMADSSDEAEKSQPAQADKEGGPDQSESAGQVGEAAAATGAEAAAMSGAEAASVTGAEASSEAGAAASVVEADAAVAGAEAVALTDGEAVAAVDDEATDEATNGSENSPDQSV